MEFAPKDRVDRFELIEPLGAGGQGTVWKAQDRLEPEHFYALKLVTLSGTRESELERLRREARALSALEHPSLVRCTGVFEDLRRGVLGLVMDFVAGRSLRACLGDSSIDAASMTLILRHLAGALAYLHERGILHRDLKLENVVIGETFLAAPEDPAGVKLVDFGIAITRDSESRLTMVGGVVGTPAYLAPELLDPGAFEGDPVSPAIDVFAFGVLAALTVTGEHPSGVAPGSGVYAYAEAYRRAARGEAEFPVHTGSGQLGELLADCLRLRAGDRIKDGRALLLRLRTTEVGAGSVRAPPDAPTAVASPNAMQGDTELALGGPPDPPLDKATGTQVSAEARTEAAEARTEAAEARTEATEARTEAAEAVPRSAGPSRPLWIPILTVALAVGALFAAAWYIPPLLNPDRVVSPSALPSGPEPSASDPMPTAALDAGLDAEAEADAPVLVLPAGCNDVCACCPSGRGCEPDPCDTLLHADEDWNVRIASIDFAADASAYGDLVACVRVTGQQNDFECYPQAADSPTGAYVTTSDLVEHGLDIHIRTQAGAELLQADGIRFQDGIRREALCRGIPVKPTGGSFPATRLLVFLDRAETPPPGRCPPAAP